MQQVGTHFLFAWEEYLWIKPAYNLQAPYLKLGEQMLQNRFVEPVHLIVRLGRVGELDLREDNLPMLQADDESIHLAVVDLIIPHLLIHKPRRRYKRFPKAQGEAFPHFLLIRQPRQTLARPLGRFDKAGLGFQQGRPV